MSPEQETRPNPYVGPRSFQEGENLYGRDQEALDLLDLLISERIVLLYSPSGAGKTSLIQASLIPKLLNEEFFVLPTVRMNKEPPPDSVSLASSNRYLLSALLSLEESTNREESVAVEKLAGMDLESYLEHSLSETDEMRPAVFIFDQFEEILTVDPVDQDAKSEFFKQLGAVLSNRRRWALFAMREDHVAGLDPFLRPIPTRLGTTFRLDLLGPDAARLAIQQPASDAGVTFTDSAASRLVDDLRRVRVQRPEGGTTQELGPYIEPVQLQVVCHGLWQRLPESKREIVEADLGKVGDVDTALADYYAEEAAITSASTGVRERAIREWFDRQLITDQGIRGQVLQERDRSRGLENKAIASLVDAHLVRAERRRGATWYELAHDRLIDPIRKNNVIWREANLSTFQRLAALWESGRSESLLLTGEELTEAENWAATHSTELTSVDNDFLSASRRSRIAATRVQRMNRIVRVLAFLIFLLFLGVSVYAWRLWEEVRPWGSLTNLATGTRHELKGEVVSIGRSTEDFKNQIDVRYDTVSRIHLFISRTLSTSDIRTLMGTTLNGKPLPYGESETLADDDIIVLGNLGTFRFKKIVYSFFRAPSAENVSPPAAWGIFIDDTSKRILYLQADKYYVSLDEKNQTLVQERETPNTVITLRRRQNPKDANVFFSLEDREDSNPVWALLKTGDTYTYRFCKIPSGKELYTMRWETLECIRARGRDDYLENERKTHYVFHATYFLSKDVHFRIVPILPEGSE